MPRPPQHWKGGDEQGPVLLGLLATFSGLQNAFHFLSLRATESDLSMAYSYEKFSLLSIFLRVSSIF